MKNRVQINLGGRDFTLLADEEEGYVRNVVAQVDEQLHKMMQESGLSLMDSALLSAVNFCDEMIKAQETAENLRRQLKEYLEEASRIKMELSEARREIFRLQNKK